MTKIRTVIIIVAFIYNFLLNVSCVIATSLNFETDSYGYSSKGDTILNYYETLADKTNSSKYLNAAKYFYYQASRTDLSNPNAFIGRARVALLQNRTRDAKNNLMIAINFHKYNPKVLYYLGETFEAEEEYMQAIDFYYLAYSHGYKNDFKTNMRLGSCYEKLDDIKKSQYHYSNAVRINPNSDEARQCLERLDDINTNYQTYDSLPQDDDL